MEKKNENPLQTYKDYNLIMKMKMIQVQWMEIQQIKILQWQIKAYNKKKCNIYD